MALNKVKVGSSVVITRVNSGHNARTRLQSLGIYPGSIISVMFRGAFCGATVVIANGSEVAIGDGIASRIEVDLTGA